MSLGLSRQAVIVTSITLWWGFLKVTAESVAPWDEVLIHYMGEND